MFGANIVNTSKELLFTLANNFCYQAVKQQNILIENPNVIRNFLPYSILIRCLNDLISKHKNNFLLYNLGFKTLSLFELSKIILKRYEYKFKKACSIKTKNIFTKEKNKLKFESNYKFYRFNNVAHLNSEHPNLLKNIKIWFENHQGKNVVEFIDFGSKKEAIDLIELSSRFYKRANKNPRG